MDKDKFLSRNLLLLFCSMSMSFFVEYSIIAVFPVYISENLHYGRSYVGLFIGIFSVSALVIKFFTGYIADKTGRMAVLVVGLVLCLICSGFYAFTTMFTALVFVRLLQGAGSGAIRAVYPAITVDIVGKLNAGKGLGFIGLTCMIGMVVASPIVFYVLESIDYKMLFMSLGIILALSLVPVMFMRVPKIILPSRKLTLASFLEYRVLMPSFLKFIVSIWHGLFVSYAVLHARHSGITNAGVVLTAYALGNIIMRPFAGYVIDKKSPGVIAWLAYGLLMAGYCIFAVSSGYSGIVSGAFIIGMGAGIEHTMIPTIAAKIVDKSSLGRATSTLECAFSMGIITGAVFCGKATESIPFDTLFISVGILNIIPAVLFYLFVLKIYNRHFEQY